MIEYFLMGFLAPSILNLVHLVINVYVVTARGSVMSLGFSGISFITKSMGMIFFTWLGVEIIGLDFRIYVPILSFVWFFSHLCEAFVIHHYMEQNVPRFLQELNDKMSRSQMS